MRNEAPVVLTYAGLLVEPFLGHGEWTIPANALIEGNPSHAGNMKPCQLTPSGNQQPAHQCKDNEDEMEQYHKGAEGVI